MPAYNRVIRLCWCKINMDEERLRWSAFKKEHKAIYPLVSKLDKKYYQRLRIVYKAQRDCVQTLDTWLRNDVVSNVCRPERSTEEDQ